MIKNAMTGGYGSSYATSAAQQAYQQQIGGLASAIPTPVSYTHLAAAEHLQHRTPVRRKPQPVVELRCV